MPLQIQCSGCQQKMQVPDEHAGKKIRCPKCQTVVTATPPAASGIGQANADRWFLKAEDGNDYGPVPKPELDQWLAEGRITAQCQLLREGDAQWQWAASVYTHLAAAQAAPAPTVPAPAPAPPVDAGSGIGAGGPFVVTEKQAEAASKSTDDGRAKNTRAARKMIKLPAIFLMVGSALAMISNIGGLIFMMYLAGQAVEFARQVAIENNQSFDSTQVNTGLQLYMGMMGCLIFLNAFVCYGAMTMKNLQSYGMAMFVSILAIFSCWPVAIWALIVINKPEVKEAFLMNKGRYRR